MMPNDAVRIIPADLTDPRLIALLEIHVASATADMPRESCHALDVAALQRPEIGIWAMWQDDRLLGVGALRDLGGGHGEVKSMHVAAAARGRGLGAAMLSHIVDMARARGFRRLSLETGGIAYFAPARSLYAQYGFVPCDAFGDYRPDPNSVYLSRAL